jgi:ATP-binding cassette subfamily B protein
VAGDSEFRELTFRYPGAHYDALKNISFTLKAGESLGVVGRTGAGKTTLVDLLLRTYNVPDGTIFVDGRDINSVRIRDLRAGCAYVPQDNFLFSDTIGENIAFGVESGSEEAIRQAAVLADVDGNVSQFPRGYDTVLGERGVGLSGGERQRLSIARAVLKKPNILFFDEAPASADSETEQLIQESIEKLISGRTTLMVAHRLSTLRKANKIIVVDRGKILEMGTPEELLEKKGKYYKLVQIQTMSDELKKAKKEERFD